MKILHVVSEVAPWSTTGGLAHVAGALPAAQARHGGLGVQVAIVAPAYRDSIARVERAGRRLIDTGIDFSVELAGARQHGRALAIEPSDAAPVFLLDCPAMFEREGIYGHADDALRFGLLSRGAIDVSDRILGGMPDILHAHDWPAGLVPAYARAVVGDWMKDTRCVFTIHNLAYQGVFPKQRVAELGVPWWTFTHDRLEFYDQLSMLKAGIAFSDAVTTVSPTYAAEILTPAHGAHLDGFLRDSARRLTGILNGIDVAAWDPSNDPHIAAPFSPARFERKAENRAALLTEVDLDAADGPVFGVVTRLADQKGMDLVAEMVPQLPELGARLVLLGSGDHWLEDRFRLLASWFPRHLAVRIGYDEALAHRIYAGSDAILAPSRFEPCGLTQMYAMRYGALPIAHAVGGLRDTVIDPGDAELARGNGTGIRFEHATAEGLLWAVRRTCDFYRRDPAGWRTAAVSIMQRDVSWSSSARAYLALYDSLWS